jgi:hypothetical protein
MNRKPKLSFGAPYKPILTDKEIPVRKGVPLKENLVEVANVNGVRTTCHFMKYVHSTVEPAITKDNGDYFWYDHGKLHRDGDEPAVYQNKDKIYYKHGKIHRDDDKPAVIRANGTLEYFKEGVRYTPEI